jgi:tetratricopeptide (TPR) repeat protein
MHTSFFAFSAMLCLVSSAAACLWDRDTLEHEAQGVPDAMDIIAGRFERNPPLYYQMRLERVTALLQHEPMNLSAYDDAAVACDRLGDDNQAISFMQRKAQQLGVANATDKNDQQYRYEANIGTFYIHRWIRGGAHRENMGDVDEAIHHIGEALRINPNAHFGRERYQLLAIQWIRNPDDMKWGMAEYAAEGKNNGSEPAGNGNAIEGLSGLIALGNAWESVDVFYALGLSLRVEGRSTVAFLTEQRIDELIDKGAHSLYPQQVSAERLKQYFSNLSSNVMQERKSGLLANYKTLRASADKWQANRTAYMLERLQKGKHPDTDPNFWADYKEVPHPSLYDWNGLFDKLKFWTANLLVAVLLAIGLLRAIRLFRGRFGGKHAT